MTDAGQARELAADARQIQAAWEACQSAVQAALGDYRHPARLGDPDQVRALVTAVYMAAQDLQDEAAAVLSRMRRRENWGWLRPGDCTHDRSQAGLADDDQAAGPGPYWAPLRGSGTGPGCGVQPGELHTLQCGRGSGSEAVYVEMNAEPPHPPRTIGDYERLAMRAGHEPEPPAPGDSGGGGDGK